MSRIDEYLVDRGQTELGLKKRGTKPGVEIKGLVAPGTTTPPPFAGRVQIWCKWTSEPLTIDHLPRVVLQKTRWLRKYERSDVEVREVELDAEERPRHAPGSQLERGCQIELVALRLAGGSPWWSLGFEAFGELPTLEESLRRTIAHVASAAPDITSGLERSYPAWLAEVSQ